MLPPALRATLRRGYYALCFPRLPDADPGPLTDATAAALRALVEVVVEAPDPEAPDRVRTTIPIDLARYEVLFRRRAASVRGWLSLSGQLAADLDARAARTGGRSFAACDVAARRAVAARLFGAVGVVRWSRVAASLFHRRTLRSRDHVIAPALLLYSRTDALLRVGYDLEHWPGRPAGLESYQRPQGSHCSQGPHRSHRPHG
jgi:hypothetical protein